MTIHEHGTPFCVRQVSKFSIFFSFQPLQIILTNVPRHSPYNVHLRYPANVQANSTPANAPPGALHPDAPGPFDPIAPLSGQMKDLGIEQKDMLDARLDAVSRGKESILGS
jgi:hypothetical protein